ncbi:MAG: hypothetical protein MMC33_003212 [Icmadophila ericetorum]|nr:hypothetical protein [Icmadophila ericetorum]
MVCTDEEKVREGKTIVETLAKLKYELQHDRKLTPLPDDGQPDIALYNLELEALGSPTWFSVPWLYSECYLYRRLSTAFALSQHWKNYDVFGRQKMSTFKSSRPAVLELSSKYKELVLQLESNIAPEESNEEHSAAERLLFTEMCEICLWGNATDLSLLTSLTYEDIQKLQGSDARKASEKNIIANDLPAAYAALKSAQKSRSREEDRQIDIILDNAGFELFVDLILAGYLLITQLATRVILHPKSIPWFVSDVIPADFSALLSALSDPQKLYSTPTEDEKHAEKPAPAPLSEKEVSELEFLFESWSQFHAEGKLIIRPNGFWTHGGSFWRLPSTTPVLFQDLKESQLVIFKGDLNYRKLTGDVMWPPTTSFEEAIGPLGVGSGVRVLALRTCKADVVVGLEEGIDEKLRAEQGGGEVGEGASGQRKWAWSGKWAVCQFCDGKV